MKALTIKQPLASAVADGRCFRYTCRRNTLHRGPLLIHASVQGDPSDGLPRGCVIARTNLVDVVPDEKGRYLYKFNGTIPVVPKKLKGRPGIFDVQVKPGKPTAEQIERQYEQIRSETLNNVMEQSYDRCELIRMNIIPIMLMRMASERLAKCRAYAAQNKLPYLPVSRKVDQLIHYVREAEQYAFPAESLQQIANAIDVMGREYASKMTIVRLNLSNEIKRVNPDEKEHELRIMALETIILAQASAKQYLWSQEKVRSKMPRVGFKVDGCTESLKAIEIVARQYLGFTPDTKRPNIANTIGLIYNIYNDLNHVLTVID